MESRVLRPANRFLNRQRDRHWHLVLAGTLVLALVVALVLALVGWPRLESMALHYDLLRLRGQVEELERHQRELEAELEAERNPVRLARRAREIGLVPPEEAGTPGVEAAP